MIQRQRRTFLVAAGAMLALVAMELVPQALVGHRWREAGTGTLAGAAVMLALALAVQI